MIKEAALAGAGIAGFMITLGAVGLAALLLMLGGFALAERREQEERAQAVERAIGRASVPRTDDGTCT